MRWLGVLISLLLIGGIVALSGCISEEKDSDGDGVPDDEDQYPGEDDHDYLDDDKDGVLNKDDKYPDRNDSRFGGTIIRWQSEPSTLDPVMVTDQASIEMTYKIFDGLVHFKPGTTEIEPGLAKSWDVTDDGLEYTFYLREGVKFHNGRNLTATDVKYSIDRLMDPATASPRIGFADDIESVTVELHCREDQHQVRLCPLPCQARLHLLLPRPKGGGGEARGGLVQEPGRNRPLQVREVGPGFARCP
jgi:ABC-type transport system substrate-binding protein